MDYFKFIDYTRTHVLSSELCICKQSDIDPLYINDNNNSNNGASNVNCNLISLLCATVLQNTHQSDVRIQ